MKTQNLVLIAAGLYLGYRLLSKANADNSPTDVAVTPIKPQSGSNATDITQINNYYQTAQDQQTNPTDPTAQVPGVIVSPNEPASLVKDIADGNVAPPTYYYPPVKPPQPAPAPAPIPVNYSMPDAPVLKGLNSPVHAANKTIYFNMRTAEKTSGKVLINLFKASSKHGFVPVSI
jgi:hypothetical protein